MALSGSTPFKAQKLSGNNNLEKYAATSLKLNVQSVKSKQARKMILYRLTSLCFLYNEMPAAYSVRVALGHHMHNQVLDTDW